MENHAPRGWIFCTEGKRVDVNRRTLSHRVLNAVKRRLNQGSPNSFVLRWRDPTGIYFTFLRILRLGESKSSMTKSIAASNTSGRTRRSYPTHPGDSLTPHNSIFWGPTEYAWDLDYGRSENGTKVRCPQVPRNYITERFHRPGILLGQKRRRVADLEVDPCEGRKCVHTFVEIIRSVWFGLPPSIWRRRGRAVLYPRSTR